MANLGRGERMVHIFAYLMAHYDHQYTVTEIMHNLDIPEGDLRNVQRDMVALTELPGKYIVRCPESGRTYYQVNLPKAKGIQFPEFSDIVLQYVFLQRVANLYPATATLVTELVEKISATLPSNLQDDFKRSSKSLNDRILFMGKSPEFNDEMGKKLTLVLKAISQSRKVKISYEDNFGNCTEKTRIPLMIVIEGGEPYVACVSQSNPGKTYVLKLRRIREVKLTREMFTASPADLENIRRRVRTGAMFFGEQAPNSEEIEIFFPRYSKNTLLERPYNRTMKIKKYDEDTILVTMKAEVNESLRQWVMFHGNNATVAKPKSLQKILLDAAKRMIAKYKNA